MLTEVYAALIKRFPDHLISVSVNYSPGIPGRIDPFYYAVAYINNVPTYQSPTDDTSPNSEEALKHLLFYINLS